MTSDLAEPRCLARVLPSLILVCLERCETFMCSLVNPTEGSAWRLFDSPRSAFLGISSKVNQAQSEPVASKGELSVTCWWVVQIRKLRPVLELFSERVLSGYSILNCRFLLKLQYILFGSVLESRKCPGFFSYF